MDDERKKKDDLGVVLGWLIGKQMAERPTFLAETAFFCWRYQYLEFRAFAPLRYFASRFSSLFHSRRVFLYSQTILYSDAEDDLGKGM